MQPTIWNDERITAYILGELSESDTAKFEQELSANADLAAAVAEAKQITSGLSSLFASEPPMTLDAAKRQQILSESHVPGSPSNAGSAGKAAAVVTPPVAFSRVSVRTMALAATVLLIGTTASIVYLASTPENSVVTMGRVDSANVDLSRVQSLEAAAPQAAAPQAAVPQDAALQESAPQVASGFQLSFGEEAQSMRNAPTGAALSKQLLEEEAFADAMAAKDVIDEKSSRRESMMKSQLAPAAAASVPASDPAPAEPLSRAKEAESMDQPVQLAAPATAASAAPATDGAPIIPSFGAMDSLGMGGGLGGGLGGEGMAVTSDGDVVNNRFSSSEFDIEMDGMRGVTGLDVAAPGLSLPERRDRSLDRALATKPLDAEGRGPGMGGDRFEPIIENDFRRVSEAPLSTFSIDVDTASYSKVRQFILQTNQLPPAGAVRVEELINYFDYADEPPAENDEHPFVARVEMAVCPWKPEHRLARIAIKGKEIAKEKRPASNLVFLVDTSGSMEEPNKLPLVKQGLQRLVEQLGEKDRVAIVVYAGSAGLVLDSTPATERATILRRINQMQSGGSTNGGEGIRLAYQVARDHFIAGGVNRVILCSDGDFNVGTTSDDELVTLVETQAKGGIDLTVLGFGMGNHNDSMMERISGRGNGNYAFIDSQAEAQRVLVDQVSATLVTIARDVKLQVEFNPAEVAAYRLIGYENRRLANEDFKDDTKDAGEIGAGHAVTALYELIPASGNTEALAPTIDELRYQRSVDLTDASRTGEWMTVGIRYKKPGIDVSTPLSMPAKGDDKKFAEASEDFRFTAAVAAFGMLLRKSEYSGNWTMSDVQRIASEAKGDDPHGLRGEFIEMVSKAAGLRSSER